MKHLLLALLLAASTAHALQDRVLAVVNQSIITEGQVDARTAIRIQQLGIKDVTAQQREALAKRTLGDMVDEELEAQYADQVGISVPDDLMLVAYRKITTENPHFKSLPAVQTTALKEQIRAEIRWNGIVQEVLKKQIEISNAETDQIIAEMSKSSHVLERNISQIFKAVEGNNESEAQAAMNKIMSELKAGKDFATLARTESEDQASASNGGNMGWFNAGELNPQLEGALNTLKPGEVSGLIRTPLGFHIVKLENVRTTQARETGPITETRMFILGKPATPSTSEAVASELRAAANQLSNAEDLQTTLADATFTQTFPASADLGWVNAKNLQPALLHIAETLKAGQWSDPFTMNENLALMFKGESRQAPNPNLAVYRERVKNHLMQNRLELASRRLLRDLRAKAFVDIRW